MLAFWQDSVILLMTMLIVSFQLWGNISAFIKPASCAAWHFRKIDYAYALSVNFLSILDWGFLSRLSFRIVWEVLIRLLFPLFVTCYVHFYLILQLKALRLCGFCFLIGIFVSDALAPVNEVREEIILTEVCMHHSLKGIDLLYSWHQFVI